MTISIQDAAWEAGSKLIIKGVTIEVEPGRVLGLLGPNGSGKSSLLRLICRIRPLSSGVITVGDVDIQEVSRLALAKRIALVEQQVSTEAPVTVMDVVRLGRTPHRGPLAAWSDKDAQAVDRAMHITNIWDRRNQPWQTLSGGERQRTQIARALAQEPSELLLDEPTNHLDIRHQLELMALLAKLRTTSVVALHDINLAASFCDSLAVLNAGQVVAAGVPAQVLSEGLLRDVFGVHTRIEAAAPNDRPRVHFLSAS